MGDQTSDPSGGTKPCRHCGFPNRTESAFCGGCGRPLLVHLAQARSKLVRIVADHGRIIVADHDECARILDKSRGSCAAEFAVLAKALELGVPDTLASMPAGSSSERLETAEKLAGKLVRGGGMDDATARWAVESWALALGGHAGAAEEPAEPDVSAPYEVADWSPESRNAAAAVDPSHGAAEPGQATKRSSSSTALKRMILVLSGGVLLLAVAYAIRSATTRDAPPQPQRSEGPANPGSGAAPTVPATQPAPITPSQPDTTPQPDQPTTTPPSPPQSPEDRLVGLWLNADYISGLREKMSQARSGYGRYWAALEVSRNPSGQLDFFVHNFHEGMHLKVASIEPTGTSGTYAVHIDSQGHNEYVVTIGIDEPVTELVWDQRSGAGENFHVRCNMVRVPDSTPAQYINRTLLVGEYRDDAGQRYSFSDTMVAEWPDGKFNYEIGLDTLTYDGLTLVSNLNTGESSNRRMAFSRRPLAAGPYGRARYSLLLFNLVTRGNPDEEGSTTPEDTPFAVLTPAEKP